MNPKTLKALAALTLVSASLFQATMAYADGPTTDYVSPGLGTLIVRWLSNLR